MKSRRAMLVEPGKLELQEVHVDIAADELLIQVEACGLCTWELNHFHGRLGHNPQPLGHEWSGRVIGLGQDTQGFKEGDLVTGLPNSLTGFSDYMAVKAANSFIVAPHVSPEHALGEPLKCIVTVLRGAAPEAGDYGVVMGAGPMGLWAVQALAGKLLGGLIVIDIDDRKLALASKFGATHTINAKVHHAEEIVREVTGGHMADFVIEGTGSTAVINSCIGLLKAGRGRLILMSAYKSAGSIDMEAVISKSIEVRATHPGYSVNEQDDQRRAVILLNNGVFAMEEIISHRFALDEIQLAFDSLDQRPDGYLKGIVVPGGGRL
ncbi:zinc-binding dehydrogenase [Paenibacillus sp. GCM10023252]|uniref:zinc-dependent alcohol dehydrogenase n=1 Tax=Paenibacillus sp. GCM10023252 TaxID=3252649 RepID=UPI00360F7536